MPCRHIFKCRAELSLSLIEANMIKDVRHDSLLNSINDVDAYSDSETIKQIYNLNRNKKQNNSSVKDKYNLAWNQIKELVSALSVINDEDFDEQFFLILEIKSYIEINIQIQATPLDADGCDNYNAVGSVVSNEIVECVLNNTTHRLTVVDHAHSHIQKFIL